NSRLEALRRKFNAIRDRQPPPPGSSPDIPVPTSPTSSPVSHATDTSDPMAIDTEPNESFPEPYDPHEDALPPLSACAPAPPSKKDEEEAKANHWKEALKALVEPLIEYSDRTMGVEPEKVVRAGGARVGRELAL
ncbi:hypothetical protein PQX77_003632, partial [Marasmius sp. AFHP31]